MNYEDFLNRLSILTEETGPSGLTLSPEVEADIDKFNVSDSMKKGIKGMVIGVYSGKLNGDTKKILDKVYTVKSVDSEGKVLQAVGGKKDTSSTANVNNTKKVWDDDGKKKKTIKEEKNEETINTIVDYVYSKRTTINVEGFIYEAIMWLHIVEKYPSAELDGVNNSIMDVSYKVGKDEKTGAEQIAFCQCKWITGKENSVPEVANTKFNSPFKDWEKTFKGQDSQAYVVFGGNFHQTVALVASWEAISKLQDLGHKASDNLGVEKEKYTNSTYYHKVLSNNKGTPAYFTKNEKRYDSNAYVKHSKFTHSNGKEDSHTTLIIKGGFWVKENLETKRKWILDSVKNLCDTTIEEGKYKISKGGLDEKIEEFKKYYNKKYKDDSYTDKINMHADNMKSVTKDGKRIKARFDPSNNNNSNNSNNSNNNNTNNNNNNSNNTNNNSYICSTPKKIKDALEKISSQVIEASGKGHTTYKVELAIDSKKEKESVYANMNNYICLYLYKLFTESSGNKLSIKIIINNSIDKTQKELEYEIIKSPSSSIKTHFNY